VPDPPERNQGDAGFLNLKAKKINLGTERCSCCAAQMVSAFPSTAPWGGGNWKGITGEPKVGIKGKECHTMYNFDVGL
jgi:hypothetical protein